MEIFGSVSMQRILTAIKSNSATYLHGDFNSALSSLKSQLVSWLFIPYKAQ